MEQSYYNSMPSPHSYKHAESERKRQAKSNKRTCNDDAYKNQPLNCFVFSYCFVCLALALNGIHTHYYMHACVFVCESIKSQQDSQDDVIVTRTKSITHAEAHINNVFNSLFLGDFLAVAVLWLWLTPRCQWCVHASFIASTGLYYGNNTKYGVKLKMERITHT